MKKTPIYQIPYLQGSDPLRLIGDIDEEQATAIENALRERGVTPTSSELLDLVARLNTLDTQRIRAVGALGLVANWKLNSSSRTQVPFDNEIELDQTEVVGAGGIRVLHDGDYLVSFDLTGKQADNNLYRDFDLRVNGVVQRSFSAILNNRAASINALHTLPLVANDVVSLATNSSSNAVPTTFRSERARFEVRRLS